MAELKREWFYRLYSHAKSTGALPLLVSEIERSEPWALTRYKLELETAMATRPKVLRFATGKLNLTPRKS